MVKLMLHLPLIHNLASSSLLVIYFKGRKSGKQYSTPVRYHTYEGRHRSFSSDNANWWKNFREGADVELHLQGRTYPYHAVLLDVDTERKRELFQAYLSDFPGDAAYHELKIKNGKFDETELSRAIDECKIVEYMPRQDSN